MDREMNKLHNYIFCIWRFLQEEVTSYYDLDNMTLKDTLGSCSIIISLWHRNSREKKEN